MDRTAESNLPLVGTRRDDESPPSPQLDSPRQNAAGWFFGWCILGSSLVVFGLAGLAFSVVATVLRPVLPGGKGKVFGRFAIHYLFRFFLRYVRAIGGLCVDTSGLRSLNRDGPVIIAPNHLSLLDALFVISEVPEVACIMKAKIWDNPVLGGGARLAQYIRNDAPSAMVRASVRELSSGYHLLLFPEGTRVETPPVNPFRGGFGIIARRAGVPVQTVFIESSSQFLGKGWPLWKRPVFPVRFRVRLGERFSIRPGEDTKVFVGRVEGYYRDVLSGRVPVATNQ